MRIIAGRFRGRALKSPPSLNTRPTSDRLRETLFNVIAPRVEGARFLDLCAGSGAVGIEALSRGASHVTFVDRSRKMGALVNANLDLCRIEEDEREVVIADAIQFLRQRLARGAEPWDIVFFDPPYASNHLPVLECFGRHSEELLEDESLLIVEHASKSDLIDVSAKIKRYRVLTQGDSALSFYRVDPTPLSFLD